MRLLSMHVKYFKEMDCIYSVFEHCYKLTLVRGDFMFPVSFRRRIRHCRHNDFCSSSQNR